MLFTRLAIAALSLDSITRVFAAPIVAGLAGNKVALSLPVLGAPFEVFLDYTIATLAPLKDQLDDMSVNPASFTPEKLAAITGKITPAMIPVLTGLSSPIGVYNDATAVATKFNGILQLLNQMVGSTANIAEANRLAFPDVVKTHLEQLRAVLTSIRDTLSGPRAALQGLVGRLYDASFSFLIEFLERAFAPF